MRCSVCGTEGNPTERFCRNCGKVFEESEYYIWKKGTTQPLGPVTESDLKSKLAAAQLNKEDSIARVGEQNWTPIWQTPFAEKAPPINQGFANQPNIGNQPNFGNQPLGFPNSPQFMQPVMNRAGVPEAYQRGDYALGPRLGGLLIDSLIAFPLVFMAIIPFVGIIGAPLFCLYMISRDVLMGNGQSIGKKVAGTRVVRADGQPITWEDSVKRNIIYFGILALIIPYFGIFLYAFGIGALSLIEIILVLTGGQRMGDKMGNTFVVKA